MVLKASRIHCLALLRLLTAPNGDDPMPQFPHLESSTSICLAASRESRFPGRAQRCDRGGQECEG